MFTEALTFFMPWKVLLWTFFFLRACLSAATVWFIFCVFYFLLKSDDVRYLKVFRTRDTQIFVFCGFYRYAVHSRQNLWPFEGTLLLLSSGLDLKMEVAVLIINTSMRSDVQDLVNDVETSLSCQLGARGALCSELSLEKCPDRSPIWFLPFIPRTSYASPTDTRELILSLLTPLTCVTIQWPPCEHFPWLKWSEC